jgi:hypothetical protein
MCTGSAFPRSEEDSEDESSDEESDWRREMSIVGVTFWYSVSVADCKILLLAATPEKKDEQNVCTMRRS